MGDGIKTNNVNQLSAELIQQEFGNKEADKGPMSGSVQFYNKQASRAAMREKVPIFFQIVNSE